MIGDQLDEDAASGLGVEKADLVAARARPRLEMAKSSIADVKSFTRDVRRL